MKLDPHYQRQKCSPMTLKRMRIFAGVPLGRGVKWQWGCRRRQFLAALVVISSEPLEIRPAALHGDMLPLVGL